LLILIAFSGYLVEGEAISPTPTPSPAVHDHRRLIRPVRSVGRGNYTTMIGGGDRRVKMEHHKNRCPEYIVGESNQDPSDGQAMWLYDVVFSRLDAFNQEKSMEKIRHTFVEFGARDGCKESNTYWYEKHHFWSGLLIDAGRDYIDALRNHRYCRVNNRAGSCVWAALASQANQTLYWNAFDKALPKASLDHYFNESAQVVTAIDRQVKTTTLAFLLDFFRMESVSLVSADCEGCEMAALLGLAPVLGRNLHVDVFVVEHPMEEKGRPNCTMMEFFHRHHYMAVPLPFSYDYVFLHSSVVQKLSEVSSGLHRALFDPLGQRCFGRNSHPCTLEILENKYNRLMHCEAQIGKIEGVPVPLFWRHNSTDWPANPPVSMA